MELSLFTIVPCAMQQRRPTRALGAPKSVRNTLNRQLRVRVRVCACERVIHWVCVLGTHKHELGAPRSGTHYK